MHLCARVYSDPYAAYNPRKPSNVTAKLPLEMQLHHFRNVASSARRLAEDRPETFISGHGAASGKVQLIHPVSPARG